LKGVTDRTAPADPREALARALDRSIPTAYESRDGHVNLDRFLTALNDAGYTLAARQDESSRYDTAEAHANLTCDCTSMEEHEARYLAAPTRQDEPSPALRGRLLSALDDVPTHRQKIEIGDDGRPAKIGPKIARHPAFVRADCVAAVENVLAVRPQPMLTELEP
jgi:hypothetical protein